jgi:hypothetical protein
MTFRAAPAEACPLEVTSAVGLAGWARAVGVQRLVLSGHPDAAGQVSPSKSSRAGGSAYGLCW